MATVKYICEHRGGGLWVRGKCCINRVTGELREDYSGWIVRDITVPTPNILCDEEGHLIWEVKDNKVVAGVSPLTEKEQAVKDKPTMAEKIEALKARITELEGK